jgi:hypothetical protein
MERRCYPSFPPDNSGVSRTTAAAALAKKLKQDLVAEAAVSAVMAFEYAATLSIHSTGGSAHVWKAYDESSSDYGDLGVHGAR